MARKQAGTGDRGHPGNLSELLEHIDAAASEHDPVTLADVIESVGKRSFGPLLLMVGAMIMSPISGIPGLPSMMSLLVVLVAGQMLLGRRTFWIPQWLLRKSLSQSRVSKVVGALSSPAKYIDKLLKPRLTSLIDSFGRYCIALICLFIAVLIPAMELVPMLASMAGVVLLLYGLALVSYDGALAAIAMALTAIMGLLLLYGLLG